MMFALYKDQETLEVEGYSLWEYVGKIAVKLELNRLIV